MLFLLQCSKLIKDSSKRMICVKIWCTQSIFLFIHIFILVNFFSYEIVNLLKCDKILMLHVSDVTHARPHSCHCTYCEIMKRQMCAKNWLINKCTERAFAFVKDTVVTTCYERSFGWSCRAGFYRSCSSSSQSRSVRCSCQNICFWLSRVENIRNRLKNVYFKCVHLNELKIKRARVLLWIDAILKDLNFTYN